MKLGNAYLGSSIKKRIEIMKNPAKVTAVKHYIAPILLVSAMFWLFSCEENQDAAYRPFRLNKASLFLRT
ncbi:MAG: hypothetical protein U5K79_16165 [Cyclobacteriaceae bacterium]|nr:hypothetical protein [Cyclobacteriaceae bacterium]